MIKRKPPMKKWVTILLIFYFLCIMRIYGTPRNYNMIEFTQYIFFLFKDLILDIINSDIIFSYFFIVIICIVLFFCIIDKEFRYMFLEELIVLKKEITGEIRNEEWAGIRKLAKNQIHVCQQLIKYKEMFIDLCEKANVHEINFIMDNSEKSIIASLEKEGQPPMISIKTELINRLEAIEPCHVREKVLRFVIAHELIHVKYHDSINKIWMWRFYVLLWIGGLSLFWNYFGASISLGIVHKWISVILLLLWCIFASVLISQSFWWQVLEFRADRLGLKISGESVLVFEIYAKYFPDGVFGKNNLRKRLKNYQKAIISFFFEKATQNDEIGHPSNHKRIEELKRGKNWTLFEYFRYGYQMKKNSLLGNGKKM